MWLDEIHTATNSPANTATPTITSTPTNTLTATPTPLVLIVDDQDTGFSFEGGWITFTSTQYDKWLSSVRYKGGGNGSGTATFTPSLPAGGQYAVFIWLDTLTVGATNMPVTINYEGGSSTIPVNIKTAPSSGGCDQVCTGVNYYTFDIANRLTSVDGVTYTWDANGNLLSDGTSTYTNYTANRMTGVTQSGNTYTFAYNDNGDRLQQTVNSVTTSSTLDLNAGLRQVLADGTDTYLYGNGRIAKQASTTWAYYHPDALGSVRQLSDASGTLTLGQSFEPYGDVLNTAGTESTSYGYTGEWTDGTALVNLRARYLNTSVGRFMSRDTWAGDYNRPLSLNKWNYVEGNPVNSADPFGYCSQKGWDDLDGFFTESNCDRLESGDLKFTEQWYYAFADYVDADLPQTAANMRHYLIGSGSQKNLSSSFMRDDIYGWNTVSNQVSELPRSKLRGSSLLIDQVKL